MLRPAICSVLLIALVLLCVRSRADVGVNANPAPTTTTPQPVDAVTTPEDPLKPVILEMEATAKAVYEELEKSADAAAAGPADARRPTPEEFYRWSQRVDLGMPSTAHLQRMRKRLEREEALHAQGRSTRANLMAYRYFVAEAEFITQQNAQLRESAKRMAEEVRDLYRSMKEDSQLTQPPSP